MVCKPAPVIIYPIKYAWLNPPFPRYITWKCGETAFTHFGPLI